MKIGVPKEIKTNENRIALVPAGAQAMPVMPMQQPVPNQPGFIPPPPPPGMEAVPGAPMPVMSPPPVDGPATVYVRVNGDDFFLNAMLGDLMSRGIPVFGFEEVVGNLEDIFLRTTRGLVQ